MKLCITAAEKNIDANVDTRFGRAPWLLILDTDTGAMIEAVENTAAAQAQGAGIATAKLMSDRNVAAILTGSVGPNAASVFQATGVSLFEGISPQDTVQEALAKFKQGAYGQGQAQNGASTTPPTGQGEARGRGIAGGGRGMGGGAKGRGSAGGGRGMGGGGRGRGSAGGGRGMGGGGGQGMGG